MSCVTIVVIVFGFRLEASNQENSQLKQRMETLESDNR